MAKTALATDNLESLERQAPAIDPARQTLQAHGHCYAEYVIRAPKDFVADDLKEPAVWKKVQAGSRGLRKWDRLIVIAFDESWVAEAIVGHADANGAVLCKPRLTTMPARYDALFEDDKYKVEWAGHGYAVIRKIDNVQVSQPVASHELAVRNLASQYPVVNR